MRLTAFIRGLGGSKGGGCFYPVAVWHAASTVQQQLSLSLLGPGATQPLADDAQPFLDPVSAERFLCSQDFV